MRTKKDDTVKNETLQYLINNYESEKITSDKHLAELILKNKNCRLMLNITESDLENTSQNPKTGLTQYETTLNSLTKTINNHLRQKYCSNFKTSFLMAYCEFFDCSADYLLGFIPFPKHENTDIFRSTGLSDKSVNVLKRRENRRDLLDTFICSEAFKELDQYAIDHIRLKYSNFQYHVKQYLSLIEVAKKLDKKDRESIEYVISQDNMLMLEIENCTVSIKHFGSNETFIFQKFIEEYKKKLSDEYEYEKYLEILSTALKENVEL